MSMHKVPLTAIEEEGLRLHGLVIGTPSQLSDCFRHGMKWQAEQSQRWISVDERLPDVRAGDNQEVILKVRRANGKEYVFAAEYLNRYECYSEDDDADDEGRIYITGWYRLMADEEYDNAWHAVLNDGDSVTGWKPLPPP